MDEERNIFNFKKLVSHTIGIGSRDTIQEHHIVYCYEPFMNTFTLLPLLSVQQSSIIARSGRATISNICTVQRVRLLHLFTY